MPKDIAHFLSLNYPIELVREEGEYVAFHPDLPGCVAQGSSADEAIGSLDEARRDWIRIGLEDKQFIPEPLPTDYSGRLSLRIPVSLHADLANDARRQGVSLNQLFTKVLSEYIGRSKTTTDFRELLRELETAKSFERTFNLYSVLHNSLYINTLPGARTAIDPQFGAQSRGNSASSLTGRLPGQ